MLYEYTRWQAAESLGKVDPRNPHSIAALVQVIRRTKDERTRMQEAEILRKIDPENPNL